MGKKIKDLTDEEMDEICSTYRNRGQGCMNEYFKNRKCPLYFQGKCAKYLIERERFLNGKLD